MTSPATRRATLVGASALLLWATLAALTTAAGDLPPFELVALSFGLAAIVGLAVQAVRGRPPRVLLRQPLGAWALSVGAFFGYHALYFVALTAAPAVEANLVNYLWPLLIVLFAASLPGERLRVRHALGAGAGFAGTALLLLGAEEASVPPGSALGYVAAAAAAVVWAGYSVANRRYRDVPSDAVAGFCLGTALLAGAAHLAFERTVVPSPSEAVAVVAMALGPLGAAFFAWDHGVKRGDVRALGTLAYATPLLSSLLLALTGAARTDGRIWAAALLIVGGAALGSGAVFRRTPPAAGPRARRHDDF